ncbi:putative PAS domain-containing protein/PAC sensor protein [Thauera sp. 27]|nr:putative PAS domain-containing protein/PAC sensor protein [Thauera sp. 27]
MALLSLLPLILLSLGLAAKYVHTLQTEMRASAERRVGNYTAQVDDFLEARILALQMLADSPLADDPARWEDLYSLAQTFFTSFNSHVIFASASDRQMRFNTRSPFGAALPRLPDTLRGRAAASVAIETSRPAVGDIVMGPVINQPLVAIVVPGVRNGQVQHLMLVTTTLNELTDRIDRIPTEPGWGLRILDSAGDLIAQKAPEAYDPERDVADDWRFVATARHAPWQVIVEVPKAVVRQPVRDSMIGFLLAIMITTLASVIVVRYAAKRIGEQASALVALDAHTPGTDALEFQQARHMLEQKVGELHKLSQALEQSPEAVIITNLAGEIEYVNPACAASSGYTKAELIGHKPNLLASGRTPADTYRGMWQSLVDGKTWRGEFINRRKDGTEYVELAIISPLRQGDGSISHYVAVKQDITERKATQDALLRSNERLQRVIDNSVVGVMFWDTVQGRLMDANDTFLEFVGFDRHDLEAGELTWQRLTPPEYIELSQQEMVKFKQSGDIGPYEKEYFRKDGSRIWFMFAGSALGEDAAVEFCIDITPLKSTETELKQRNDELERFNRAVIDRETRMIELKREVNMLARALQRPEPYDLSFMDSPDDPPPAS